MYEKRLCILKQLKKGFTADGGLLTGAVYAERTGGEVIVTPRIAGLAPLKEGRYALAIWIYGSRFLFELKGNAPIRVPGAPSLERGFSALLCFVRGETESVAYGFCGNAPSDPATLAELFSERNAPPDPFRDSAVAQPLAQALQNSPQVANCEKNLPQVNISDENVGQVSKYDDEEIAPSDYYALAEEPSKERAENAEEKRAVHPFKVKSGGLAYYRTIGDKLRETMARYPKDDRLKGAFPHSEWVRTESGALLGVIYAEGLPRFLCVAMEEPPEEAREACAFVPLTPYSEEKGLYVVFQDADTGEYVKVENC